MSEPVYKLLLAQEWEGLETSRVFLGTPLDIKDGYVHLSTAAQVVETARRHFKNKGPLVLAEFSSSDFGASLKYEAARDGSLFPHQFGDLKHAQVKRYWALKERGDGTYEFPEEFLPNKPLEDTL